MKHVRQLDGIRGFAVAIVVLFHFHTLLNVGIGKNTAALIAGRFMQLGWLGVDIFFVLSGFLITGIILKERSAPGFWKTFYSRRAFRILPAFVAVFAITLAATHYIWPTIEIRRSYVLMATFFLANWTIVTGSELPILGHLWSLAVEEQFYFLWPQAAKRLRVDSVLRLSLALTAACVVLRISLALAHVNPYTVYKITPTSVDGLAIGAALAAGMIVPRVREFLDRWWSSIAWGALGVLVAAFMLFRGSLFLFNVWSQVAAIPTVAVLVAVLIYGSVEAVLPRPLDGFLTNPVMTWLGRRSYGLYLIHEPIRFAMEQSRLHGYLARLSSGVGINVLLCIFAIVLALCLAEICWRVIEAPAQSFRRRLQMKRTRDVLSGKGAPHPEA